MGSEACGNPVFMSGREVLCHNGHDDVILIIF
jgi:hypothetical protein